MSGVEWADNSSVFGIEQAATVGTLELLVFSVIGGSNTDRYPYGWSISRDEEIIEQGPAETLAEARQLAVDAARKVQP